MLGGYRRKPVGVSVMFHKSSSDFNFKVEIPMKVEIPVKRRAWLTSTKHNECRKNH